MRAWGCDSPALLDYLYAYDTVQVARAGIARYIDFFNDERPHKALGYQTPASFYDGLLSER